MKVTQVAPKTGVSPCAVRYYTRIGLLTPARQSGNRYRRFTDADVRHISLIRKAQKLGSTLKEIRTIVEKSRTAQTPGARACHQMIPCAAYCRAEKRSFVGGAESQLHDWIEAEAEIDRMPAETSIKP